MKKNASQLKKGEIIDYNNQPWQVTKTEHNFRARGSANVKIKIKNLKNSNQIEISLRPNESINILNVNSILMQFLYCDQDNCHFINPHNYQQYQISINIVGNINQFLKEGEKLYVLLYNNKALAIRPPQTVKLKVTEAQSAIKGDTATAAKKTVKVETGVSIKVPLFIKKNDIILINPQTQEYIERINS